MDRKILSDALRYLLNFNYGKEYQKQYGVLLEYLLNNENKKDRVLKYASYLDDKSIFENVKNIMEE